MLKKKHPHWTIWHLHTGRNLGGGFGWYDEIRYAVNKAIATRIFDSGEVLKEQSLPIGEYDLEC